MKVSGFTFVRNAIRFDYPVKESILSILPLCDEFIVAAGQSEDETRQVIASLDSPKIRILDTVWDERIRSGGRVLAAETNKALNAVALDSDWAFYLQADEVVHEKYLPVIQQEMLRWKDDPRVEGLLFHFIHFWGSYDWIGNSRKWYRKEIRVIRPGIGISSYQDAQGFRKGNRKIHVKPVDAVVHHYGWVKPPDIQQSKQTTFHRYWHTEAWMKRHIPSRSAFHYSAQEILRSFTGTHPAVMYDRISRKSWHFAPAVARRQHHFLHRISEKVEQLTGWRIGEYRNYRRI